MLIECFRPAGECGRVETLGEHEHANENLDEANLCAFSRFELMSDSECATMIRFIVKMYGASSK